MRSKKTGLVFRNVLHLGIGQVVTIALGVVLTAVLGRSLGPSDFGLLYTVLTIGGFVGFAIDWGQSTYVVREIARGRSDEAEFIGSALLIGVVGSAIAIVLTIIIALVSGQSLQIVALAPLSVLAGLPFTLYQRFGFLFRGRDRMDLDVIVGVATKALTLAATFVALYLGGGVTEVVLAQAVGGMGSLAIGISMALRLGVNVKAPTLGMLHELIWAGAPIVAMSLVSGLQPFIEVLLLSALTNPEVVGWYGASRTIFGIITSPGLILSAATFPELSRAWSYIPSFRELLESTARIMLAASAFASSSLYLFADNIVTIIYGSGHFEQAARILRVGAFFLPLLFFGFLLGTAMAAIGKNKEFAVIGWIALIMGAVINWFLIGFCQAYWGNGAISLMITSGLVELFVVLAAIAILPRGAFGLATLANFARACVAAFCSVFPLETLHTLNLWLLAPLFVCGFLAAAMATGLVLPSDLRRVLSIAYNGRFERRETNS